MLKKIFTLTALISLTSAAVNADTINFSFIEDREEFVVPSGVFSIDIVAVGSSGGCWNNYGGKGGTSTGSLSVTPGESLYVRIGGYGGSGIGDALGLGGFNGGGVGGGRSGGGSRGWGGGGATDVRQGGDELTDRKIVAGGGGGVHINLQPNAYPAGNGGGLEGGSVVTNYDNTYGIGGTQTQAGAGGGFGFGGTISNPDPYTTWGGGGGGYYGGGVEYSHHGAGGSGYIGGVTNGTTTRAPANEQCTGDGNVGQLSFSFTVVPNNAPSASAGADQSVAAAASVTLDASASADTDPGDSIASYAWTQSSGTAVTLSSTSASQPTFTAPSLNVGDSALTLVLQVEVTDTQGATATDTVTITVNAVEFAAVKADVESKMAANARTQLNDFTTNTSSIVGSARSRFMNTSGVADSSDTALNGDVSSNGSDIKGSTERVTSTDDGKNTSVIEVQYQYTETKEGLKSQNASGQIINEAKLSDSLTFGRFLGATLGDGDAVGTNNIDIEFMGAQAGAYLVGNTKGGLVYDTYIAGSVIENKMGVTTSLMTADSKYYSSMLTTGASITGTLQVKKVEIRPTLSTDLSYMFRETADFNVKVGSATSVEQAAYGDIAKAQITFAPEFRLSFGEGSVITATPNVMCRYLKQGTATEDCGQGISLGFKSTSKDGLFNLTVKAGMDRIGSETTSTLGLQFEMRF